MQNKISVFFIAIAVVGLIFILFSIFYFSWTSDPSFKSETYLPIWVIHWSNENYNLRTAVPFVFFGFLLEKLSFLIIKVNSKKTTFSIRKLNFCLAFLVVFVAEIGQFFCARQPDVLDVMYGLLGSFIGGLVYYLFRKLIQLF